MPETDTIPVSASVVSVGKSLRYIGNWAYAYSGSVGVDNNETVLVESVSQSGIIVAEFQPQYLVKSGDDYFFQVYLNDLVVIGLHLTAADAYIPYERSKVIIPPLTSVKITAQNTSASTNYNVAAVLTGRVYGAV